MEQNPKDIHENPVDAQTIDPIADKQIYDDLFPHVDEAVGIREFTRMELVFPGLIEMVGGLSDPRMMSIIISLGHVHMQILKGKEIGNGINSITATLCRIACESELNIPGYPRCISTLTQDMIDSNLSYADIMALINAHGPATHNTCMSSCARDIFNRTISWSVPSNDTIDFIREVVGDCTVIDIGAGLGIWSSLLRKKGITCLPLDLERENKPEKTWTEIQYGTPSQNVRVLSTAYCNTVMLMSWPDHKCDNAETWLRSYGGDTVIYIGEWRGGCTGNADFFDLIEAEWCVLRYFEIPRWYGMHDILYVLRRKE